jgi:hypothetical protein
VVVLWRKKQRASTATCHCDTGELTKKGGNILKKNNIFRMLIAIVVLMASTQVALAYQLTFTGDNGLGLYQAYNGGEFTVILSGIGAPNVLPYYSGTTKDQGGTTGTFQTFCLEWNEHITNGGVYDAVLNPNNAAVLGGTGPSDPISKGTAWLYSQFVAGTLEGYSYIGEAQREISAALLQNTIWYLEGETAFGAPEPTAGSTFLVALKTQFGSLENAMLDYTGTGIGVLNLDASGTSTERKQDMLVATAPVPIPAAAWLLGTGLIGLIGIRRRFTK